MKVYQLTQMQRPKNGVDGLSRSCRRYWRHWAVDKCGLALGLAALLQLGSVGAHAQIEDVSTAIYPMTEAYVETFYPLWFTFYQTTLASIIGSTNTLVGPDRITPIYQSVVAINDDTLYASTFVDISTEPLVVTIPSTRATYSILTLDLYGNIFSTGIPVGQPGTYAFTGPRWSGTLPPNVIAKSSQLDYFILIFRADKSNSMGDDLTAEAEAFRTATLAQPLTAYKSDRNGGATKVISVATFATPFKTGADLLIAKSPITFLRLLQAAVHFSNIPPLSTDEQFLSDTFDRLFKRGAVTGPAAADFAGGAQAAHAAILNRYLTHTGPTNWINFTNIGEWGRRVIDRAAITEFIQYGNGPSTAAYFHAFVDGQGLALDGRQPGGYVLTFAANQIPEFNRFWSVTAYTPEAIELIPNSRNKYVVASYTPGLVKNPNDGSISIYMSPTPPIGRPEANWLPVSRGPFNIMLRVYGPKFAPGTYTPPAILRMN